MRVALLLIICMAAVSVAEGTGFQPSDNCTDTNHYEYIFEVNEEYYDEQFLQTCQMTFTFGVECLGLGTYDGDAAILYRLTDVVDTKIEGSTIDVLLEDGYDVNATIEDLTTSLGGEFTFVLITEGSRGGMIPVTYYETTEEDEIVNIKKSLASSFQANLKLDTSPEVITEMDPQALHLSTYTLVDSSGDVVKETRKVKDSDVIGFASTVPNEEVDFNQERTITISGNLVTECQGTMNIDIISPDSAPTRTEPSDSTVLEDAIRAKLHKRETYSDDSNHVDYVTDRYISKSSFQMKQTGITRVDRTKRSLKDIDLSRWVESTLQASTNKTRRAIDAMTKLREKLGDINDALVKLNRDPKDTDTASRMESLVKLEAEHGPTPGFTPAVDDVIDYLDMLIGSTDVNDVNTRLLLYYILSPEGSLPAQMAILNGLENAVDDEEQQKNLFQLAFVNSPRTEMVERLEQLISANPESKNPIILAYSSMVSRASPELQQRMTSFLLGRLPELYYDEKQLNHLILALGNTQSPAVMKNILSYLKHPFESTQLTAIYSLYSFLNNILVQSSLEEILNDPESTEAEVSMIAQSLISGVEWANYKKTPKPYPANLVHSLVIKTAAINDKELYSAVSKYLEEINTQEARDLIQFMSIVKSSDDNKRVKRGDNWAEDNPAYNVIEPLEERQEDVKNYPNHYSYIWGVIVGTSDIMLNMGAGIFVGVSEEGAYKVFGRAVAEAKVYDKKTYFTQFTALRKKSNESTETVVYGKVLGYVLIDFEEYEDAVVCYTYTKHLYEGPIYTVLDFTYPVYVKVGTVDVEVKVTSQFEVGLELSFCDDFGSMTAAAELTPTVTLNVHAEGGHIIVGIAKIGLQTDGTLTYQIIPRASTSVCYTQGMFRPKNCLGVYHKRQKCAMTQFAWYAWRGWCGWKLCSGDKAYQYKRKFDKLSFEWSLDRTPLMELVKYCDEDFKCTP